MSNTFGGVVRRVLSSARPTWPTFVPAAWSPVCGVAVPVATLVVAHSIVDVEPQTLFRCLNLCGRLRLLDLGLCRWWGTGRFLTGKIVDAHELVDEPEVNVGLLAEFLARFHRLECIE